jgi:hypothetical protein
VVKLRELREPLNTTTNRIIVVVLAAGFLFALIVAVAEFLDEASYVCAPMNGYISTNFSPDEIQTFFRPDVEPWAAATDLCAKNPTAEQVGQNLLIGLPPLLFGVGAAALLAWFLWGAARPGPHSTVSPGRLRMLGWFLTIGGPVEVLLSQYGEHLLRNSMMRDPFPINVFHQEWQHEFPWWYVFSGLTALLLSRMLRIDVRMSEDLAGTI